MAARDQALRAQRLREIEHWKLAASRLADLEALATRSAWQGLEHYVGLALRQALSQSVARLRTAAERAEQRLRRLPLGQEGAVREDITRLRAAFLRTETTLDFYADALATRANPRQGALLRACDHIATRAMAEALVPLGHQVPAVLCYLDRGLGASILKAGIRLWDPALENPVAAVKVVRHNLLRPTALIHEAGHQVAHTTGWNEPLAAALRAHVTRETSAPLGELWGSWASEIAGDAFAFVHTGYAAVVALRDVVGGSVASAFQLLPGDPHPVSWLRVLLGVEMCRQAFGTGPWDDLASAWLLDYPLKRAPAVSQQLLRASLRVLPAVARAALHQPFRAFGGKPLAGLISPERVSPLALERLRRDAGAALATSSYWLWNEAIRVVAATGYHSALGPEQARAAFDEQEQLMLRLGSLRLAA